jgi:hypothetical protein
LSGFSELPLIKFIKMTIKNLLLTFLLITTTATFAQEGQIEIQKVFGGIKLVQGGVVLKPKQVLGIMESNPAAFAEFKKAKSNNDAAQVIGFIGGALVGWPLGSALGGGDPNWALAGAGAGLILISIPMSSGYKKHATKAVELYNGKATSQLPMRLSMSPYPGGLTLRVRF